MGCKPCDAKLLLEGIEASLLKGYRPCNVELLVEGLEASFLRGTDLATQVVTRRRRSTVAEGVTNLVTRIHYTMVCKQLGQRDLRVHTINNKATKYEESHLHAEPSPEVEEIQVNLERLERKFMTEARFPIDLTS
ncbi:unnamed protein product [Cuscuta europaea]|uniref:Uncharacterized protein n=1 Tax=Cuscuta europaea TaxID=41803 RepID=A0A9P0YPW9_CUSEU|nr:unnamed protein product [Cuscuta europaea]